MPVESLEDAALRTLAAQIGARVTATNGGTPGVTHAKLSLHYAAGTGGMGEAADLAEAAPSADSPGLLRINIAALRAIPLGQLAELIYAGPGGICVKNGAIVNGNAVYGATVMAEHHNHVHVGVHLGFRWSAPSKEATVSDAPPDYALSGTPCAIAPVFDSTGKVLGYYVMTDDGSIAAIGGLPYLGRVHKA
jgi:hypothetical protein